MTKWSEKAWNDITGVYAKILEMPFIQELTDGSLDRDKFVFYIQQDALYIADFSKTLAAIACQMTDPSHRETMLGFASESVAVEKALHESVFAEYGVAAANSQSPSCLLYTSYLLRQQNAPVEVMLAATLPCFWIYREVGNYIQSRQPGTDNPYQDWINTYGDEAYSEAVDKAIAICDGLAAACTPEQQAAMTEAFVMCSKMEWLFWDSAYRLEQWKIQ